MAKSAKMRKALAKELQKENLMEKIVLTQPAPVRIFHWGFALSLTMVILTGFELHKPLEFLALDFGTVFVAHVAFAWLAVGFSLFRFADALFRQDSSLIPRLRDLKMFPKLLAYYFFLRPSPPPSGKYNSGQKLIFFSWFLLFSFITIISLSSYWMDQHLDFIPRLLGGWQVIRWIKYTALIYFSATIPLHIYLSLTEDVSKLQAMLTGYERKNPS